MRRILLFMALVPTLLLNSSAARAADRGWFLEFSGGGTDRSQTLFPIRGLEPTQSYELGSGYMLTEHIGIIPLQFGYQRFKTSDALGGYILYSIRQYQERHIENIKRRYGIEGYIEWGEYGFPRGTAELSGLRGRTGILLQSPLVSWLSGFMRLGALTLRNELITESSDGAFQGMNRRLKQIEYHYGFWLGAGIEHVLKEGMSITANLNYDRLFNQSDQSRISFNGDSFMEVIPRSNSYLINYSIGLKVGL